MKKLLALALAVAAGALVGCASNPGQPPDVVAAMASSCNIDKTVVRPNVNALLPLASADDVAKIRLAQGAIDVICASPTADKQQALAQATAAVVSIVVDIKARRAAPPAATASAPG